MGDKAYKKAVSKLRASNMATRDILKQSRMQGFSTTTDVIGGIYGNLGTTVAGSKAALTNTHTRNLLALARLADRTHSGNAKTIASGQADARNRFGSAVTGLTAPTFQQAKGHAAGADIALAGAARAGVTQARGGQTIMGILQAGVAEAQAGAQAQTADALAYRAREDAKLIADRQNLILQSKLDFQNWRRQQDYLKKAEDKAGANGVGATQVAELSVTAAVTMRNYLRANPDATIDQLVTEVTKGDSTLAANPNVATVLAQLAREVKSSVGSDGLTIDGYSRQDEANDIYNSVLLLYPHYKDLKGLRESIKTGLDAGWSAALIEADVGAGAGGTPSTTHTATTRSGATITLTQPGEESDAQKNARNSIGNAYSSEADAPPMTTGHYEERGQRGSTTTRRVWVIDGVTF